MTPTLAPDLSVFELVGQASWIVKFVMLTLVVASVWSWSVIVIKLMMLKAERRRAEAFELAFWNTDTREFIRLVEQEKDTPGVMLELSRVGYVEFRRLQDQLGVASDSAIESVRRAMRAAYQREMDKLESSLPFLATVGSVSPYIGLFGTVWGIMNSFRGLSSVAQATLAQVAPGIAEALIATAIGLFAAIPAVIAYNRFSYDIDRLANRYDAFMEEFSNVLQREWHRS